ncbi:hypothetical protein KC678_01170 [Candidatus Dojkabacteria bacterium]|uniref:Uncharacterized protein n=1 Tax=Candidatus Dojkabacteria bacterium TaxID=2099670 RepID=A0A955L160_9BACT|nr:hypothetical protein [Candidatus Dojkabacteria bacterium]
MDKQNRNTFILLIVVFIVCIVALVAVLTISWRLVGGSVTSAVSSVARYIQLQNLDYNFKVPE